MADPPKVAKRDGPHRANQVWVEAGAFLDPAYVYTCLTGERTATGHLKVIWIGPSTGPGPCFLGRIDRGGQALDFDELDATGQYVGIAFAGHHTSPLGDRRFHVDISKGGHRIFVGIVVARLGFVMHAEPGSYRIQ